MLVREATRDDMPRICALEQRPEFYGLVGWWAESEHLSCMAEPDARYLIADGSASELAGFSILRGVNSPDRSVELKRIVVGTPGRGLGSQMLRQIIHKVFEEYGAHRLWLDVFEHNLRAQRAYSGVGFRHEGILREAVFRDGKYYSLMLMSILDREYRESQLYGDDWNRAKPAP